MSGSDGRVAAQVAIAHLATLAYLVLVRVFLLGPVPVRSSRLSASFGYWDAAHYLHIAVSGYDAPFYTVFFPLFPLLVRLGAMVTGHALGAALILNFLAHVAAGCFLHRLARLDLDEATARRAVLIFLVFPAAFATVVPYSEAVYLALLLASVYAFRTGRYGLAGLLGCLVVTARLTGFLVVGIFAIEALLTRAPRRALFAIAFPALGIGLYLLGNYAATGDATGFLEVQRLKFHKELRPPTVGLLKAWDALGRARPENLTVGAAEIAGAGLAVAAAAGALFRGRKSYAAFAALSALLVVSQSWWQSNLRYAFAIFPLHLWLAQVARRDWLRDALVAAMLIVQALLAMQFARGAWSI